ncbi:methionine ABC transporter ATP-binding protein [Salirhabdus salicampi]|uniref:methionine ABC transporter ATP-binding protein n=1 Tax=Salirhabdus salicampi TaxID=476102 RepID=UPI0020C37A36|nr:methionine ABC transporter ATP-binding protein [Salirhabdus salicampi]MCP8615819.1 methionine ABC transporter ATP-binding protein [Salirhabdus salicampi]
MIRIENLVKEYVTKKKSKVIGVDNVTLSIEQGEIFGIVGYSGAGKSTLLRCINLLERPTTGKVFVDDLELTALSGKELRKARQKIGMIFQHFHLVSAKTVAENVAFSLKAAGKSEKETVEKVDKLLNMVGLLDKKDQYPAQLSGGQKQRVGIARALANDPKVLLCDEATSALDPSTTMSILKLLKKINRELDITIVIITHEMEVVKEICHRAAVMQDGLVIEEGPVYDIFSSPTKDLTKKFIEGVIQFDLPERIIQERTGTLVKLQFKGKVAEEAVVSEALQQFQVKGNILHGKIEYIGDIPLGIFVMELLGERSEIEKAIQFLDERTKHVEVISHG